MIRISLFVMPNRSQNPHNCKNSIQNAKTRIIVGITYQLGCMPVNTDLKSVYKRITTRISPREFLIHPPAYIPIRTSMTNIIIDTTANNKRFISFRLSCAYLQITPPCLLTISSPLVVLNLKKLKQNTPYCFMVLLICYNEWRKRRH